MRGSMALLHLAAEQTHFCRETGAVPSRRNEMLQQNMQKMGHLLWVRKCRWCSVEFKVLLFGVSLGTVPQLEFRWEFRNSGWLNQTPGVGQSGGCLKFEFSCVLPVLTALTQLHEVGVPVTPWSSSGCHT